MKEILEKLFQGHVLDQTEASAALGLMLSGKTPASQSASFLTIFNLRPISFQEILGFRRFLLNQAISSDFSSYQLIDVCGTGGDHKDTFNISTLTAVVLAACDKKVAKHGNYGATTLCGSSNVLEALGIKFTADFSLLRKCLDQVGICFLHAPLFHPVLKNVASIRKELNVRTFFNLLGPLVNPVNPTYQFSGVSSFAIQRLYQNVLEQLTVKYGVIYDLAGYDEVSLTGSFRYVSNKQELYLAPSDFGVKTVQASELSAGDSITSACRHFMDVLENVASEQKVNVVAANAAMALITINPNSNYQDCFLQAKEAIEAKKALAVFKKLQNLLEVL